LRGKGRIGARGRTAGWDVAGKRRAAWAWPSSFAQFRQRLIEDLQQWAIAEVTPGRLVPWLPVAFGIGIIISSPPSVNPLVGGHRFVCRVHVCGWWRWRTRSMPSMKIARAALVVSWLEAPGACVARLINRKVLRARGVIALRWNGKSFATEAARSQNYYRPWAKAVAKLAARRRMPTSDAVSPDATPRTKDLQAED